MLGGWGVYIYNKCCFFATTQPFLPLDPLHGICVVVSSLVRCFVELRIAGRTIEQPSAQRPNTDSIATLRAGRFMSSAHISLSSFFEPPKRSRVTSACSSYFQILTTTFPFCFPSDQAGRFSSRRSKTRPSSTQTPA